MTSESRVFPEAFLRAVLRRLPDVLAVAGLVLFALLAVARYEFVQGEQDVGVYARIAASAADVLRGNATSIASEYPPLATVLFWFAGAMFPGYGFPAAWVMLMVILSFCAWAYLRCYSATDACILALLLPASVLLLGHDLIFSRFDLYVAIALILSWRTYRYGSYWEGAAWLAVAAFLKVVPILAVPFLLIALPRRGYLGAALGFVFASGVVAVLCLGVLGYAGTLSNVSYLMSYHGHRAVQIETLWSTASIALSLAAGHLPRIGADHMSMVNFDVPLLVPSLSKLLIIFGVGVLLWKAYSTRSEARYGSNMILVLAGALIASPVLSPQYFTWVVPLLLFFCADRMMTKKLTLPLLAAFVLTFFIAVSTQWIFPHHYQQLLSFSPAAIAALCLRNIALVSLFIMLLAHAGYLTFGRSGPLPSARSLLLSIAADTFFVTVLFVAFLVFRPSMLTRIGDSFTVTGRQQQAVAGMPVSLDRPAKATMLIKTNVIVEPYGQKKFFRIDVDDCLAGVSVNDHPLPPDVGFCGTNSGRVFDLGEHLTPGNNTLLLTVKNDSAGPMGATITPVTTATLFLAIITLVGVFVWYVLRLADAAEAALRLQGSARMLEMLYTLLAKWKRSPSETTAQPTLLPQAGVTSI